jgi:hypothetical protein
MGEREGELVQELQVKQKHQWWYWWRKQEAQAQENEEQQQKRLWPEWESLLAQAWTLAAEKLLEVLGQLISGDVDPSHMLVEGCLLELFLDSSVSKFVEFPASFTASLQLEVSPTLLLIAFKTLLMYKPYQAQGSSCVHRTI